MTNATVTNLTHVIVVTHVVVGTVVHIIVMTNAIVTTLTHVIVMTNDIVEALTPNLLQYSLLLVDALLYHIIKMGVTNDTVKSKRYEHLGAKAISFKLGGVHNSEVSSKCKQYKWNWEIGFTLGGIHISGVLTMRGFAAFLPAWFSKRKRVKMVYWFLPRAL